MKKLDLPSFSSGFIYLISVFFLLVTIKILISFYFKSPWIFADETVYAETARNILHGEFYSKLQHCQNYPPGYPFFISIVYLIFGNSTANYQWMLIINSFLTSSIIFPVYFLLKKFSSEKFSILGSLFVAILPSVFLYNFVLMSENLFIPLFVYSLWFITETFETNSKKWGILAGFSIFLLFLTRSTGIAMVIGFFLTIAINAFIQLRAKGPVRIVKENIFLIVSFCIPTIIWVLYRSKVGTTLVSDYNVNSYSSIIFKAVSDIQSFRRFLSLIIHEVEFLILATYFILFVLSLYSLYLILNFSDKENQKKMAFKSGAIYYLVSSILLVIITVAHMSLGLFPNELDYYNILGRYIDPLVPVITIFGLIGLYIILNRKTEKETIILLMSSSILPIIFLFAIDFPSIYYKFPNMFTIFYIQSVTTFLPVTYFICLFAITVFVFFTIIVYNKKFWPFFIIFLMFIIVIGLHSTIKIQLAESSNTEKINQFGHFLIDHSNESSRILMTREDFSHPLGMKIWFATQFYSNGYLIINDTCAPISNVNCQMDRDNDYLISSKMLPYHLIIRSKSGYRLYDLKKPENQTIELP